MSKQSFTVFGRRISGTAPLAVAVIGLAAAAASPLAQAVSNNAYYSSALCNPGDGSANLKYSGGRAENVNTQKTQLAVCGTRTDTDRIGMSGLVNLNKHTADIVNCSMFNRRFDGNAAVSASSAVSGTGFQTASFSFNGISGGNTTLQCTLPKASSSGKTGILNYFLGQF